METQSQRLVPEHSDLARIQRELRFHPSTVNNPQALSAEQIESFNHNGFLSAIRIFDTDEIAEHRKYFDALLRKVQAEGGNSYSISTAHLKYARVYDLLTHPRIVAYVKDLLGENVIGWGS
ncbi:MAG TPA: phytanoyl-CoA dioxygenase family protein, partial [Blastocatellia bacterium]|nr:phytanoyl-CoA dioxygenase family protein [Blastocatellia bacterium]